MAPPAVFAKSAERSRPGPASVPEKVVESAKKIKLTVTANGTTVATFSNLNAASGYTQHTYSLSGTGAEPMRLM